MNTSTRIEITTISLLVIGLFYCTCIPASADPSYPDCEYVICREITGAVSCTGGASMELSPSTCQVCITGRCTVTGMPASACTIIHNEDVMGRLGIDSIAICPCLNCSPNPRVALPSCEAAVEGIAPFNFAGLRMRCVI
jgi:hypothetical protein